MSPHTFKYALKICLICAPLLSYHELSLYDDEGPNGEPKISLRIFFVPGIKHTIFFAMFMSKVLFI